jgi:phosphinothricin acetyltransferase
MVAAMSIRPARDSDFPALAAITNHYIVNTAIHFGYEPVTADELAGQWRTGEHPWLVLEDDQVVGYAKASTWRARAAYRWTCETGIYLAPDRHARGDGTRLYAALIDELRARGFHSIVAGVTLPNEPSLRLHQRLGFVDAGTVREAGFKHDAWHDVAFFQLRLAAGS